MNYSKSFGRFAFQYERIMLTPINDNIYFFVSTEFEWFIWIICEYEYALIKMALIVMSKETFDRYI